MQTVDQAWDMMSRGKEFCTALQGLTLLNF